LCENCAPEVVGTFDDQPETAVANIMAALKDSMDAKCRAKVRSAVRKRVGKQPEKEARPCTVTAERTPNGTLELENE
jgi:hypothetical protein